MKISFYISVASAALSLLLAVIILIFGQINQGLQSDIQGKQKEVQAVQADLQKQQEQINIANQISQQLGPNLLRDMAVTSLKDNPMKELLKKHGYNVQQQATPAPGSGGAAAAPAPAPAPAAPATTAPALQ